MHNTLAKLIKDIPRTGKLILRHTSPISLTWIPKSRHLRHLDLTDCPITSLDELPPLPSIDTIILDDTILSSLRNFHSVSTATSVSVARTPLCAHPHWKLALYLCIGPTLRIINNCVIPEQLKNRASLYPPLASSLINAGWSLVYPPPSPSEFEALASEYGLPCDQDSLLQLSLPSTASIIEQYQCERTAKLSQYDSAFQVNDYSIDAPLQASLKDRVISLLHSTGHQLPSTDDASVLSYIRSLCSARADSVVYVDSVVSAD